jgi:glycerol uptake facilitator-like aquaporin
MSKPTNFVLGGQTKSGPNFLPSGRTGGGTDNFINEPDANQVRESADEQYGSEETAMGYGRTIVMTLTMSFFFYWFLYLLRGGSGATILSFAIGGGLLRAVFTSVIYSETRGALDPQQTLLNVWAGALSWQYGVAIFLAQNGAIILAALATNFMPDTKNYGAASVASGVTDAQAFIMEMISSTAVYLLFVFIYGMRKYFASLKGDPNVKNPNFLSMKNGHFYDLHDPSVTIGYGYVAAHFVAFPITGAGLDFLSWLWPAWMSGLLSSYPSWWVYMGNLVGTLAAGLLMWMARAVYSRYYKGSPDSLKVSAS